MMGLPFPKNAFILVGIPLIFYLIWIKQLPAIYSDDTYIPKWILWIENGFRLPAFFMPLLFPLT